MKRSVAIPLIAAGAISIHAGKALAQTAGGTPYKIGVTYPLAGPFVVVSTEQLPAGEIAAADINKRGGVKGHPIQLVTEDSKGTPEGGIAAMRKLVQIDGVQCVISGFTNVVSAQIPLADQLKVPLMAIIEGAGVMSTGQYSFGHAVTILDTAPMLRDYWRSIKAKRVFVFFPNNSYAQNASPVLKGATTSSGAEYAEALVEVTATDFRGTVTQAKEFNADQIVVALQGSSTEATIIKQLRELGVSSQIVIPSNFYQSKIWRAAVGDYAEGMIFAGLYVDPVTSHDFIVAYRDKVGFDPSYSPAEVYDIVRILATAIGQAGYNGEAIRTALLTIHGVPSVFGGHIEMQPNHYTKISALGVFRAHDGKLQKIMVPRA